MLGYTENLKQCGKKPLIGNEAAIFFSARIRNKF